jgi:predicted Na+-dependent transporter
MSLLWLVLPLGTVVGTLFAASLAGAIHANLAKAYEHGNPMLSVLHAALLIIVAVFAVHGFVWF